MKKVEWKVDQREELNKFPFHLFRQIKEKRREKKKYCFRKKHLFLIYIDFVRQRINKRLKL